MRKKEIETWRKFAQVYDRMGESDTATIVSTNWTVELSYAEILEAYTLLKAEHLCKDLREELNRVNDTFGGEKE